MSRMPPLALALAVLGLATASPAAAQWILVPMDREQRNHLKAYGLTLLGARAGAPRPSGS